MGQGSWAVILIAPGLRTLTHCFSSPQRVTGCILSNVNTPSMTPVIGQPQHENTQPIYQNSNVPTKPTAGKGHWVNSFVFGIT